MLAFQIACVALLALVACSGAKVTGPMEMVAREFRCTLDQRFEAKTSKSFPVERFSFDATISEDGRKAIFQRDGRVFHARFSGMSSSRVDLSNPGRDVNNAIYRGRDAGGLVFIQIPRFSKTGPISYTQFGRDRQIKAFYQGSCS